MPSVTALLATARQNLLDLSNRNRLLNCRLDSDRVIRVFDEMPDEVFNRLVQHNKAMKFLPVPESEQDEGQLGLDELEMELAQPEDEDNGNGLAKRHADSYLQTKLTSARLQTRLLRMHTEATTAIEEQGINVLYLALGLLKWYEADVSDTARYAPLLLIPVKLDRRSATSKFEIAWSEEDIETNESLIVKMQKEFKVTLPRLPEDLEKLCPSAYANEVRKAISPCRRWEIVDDILLGFFAFGKLRMWKDLAPEAWEKGTGPPKNDMVRAILLAQPMQEPSPYSDDEFVDRYAGVHDLMLVKDADSSQVVSVLDVVNGRSAVIQGPPGTGKSQTITNIIANVLASGKTVLFVAEKMAALEVVKRWLDQVGLGDACLELHSFKARKTRVLDSIRQTIESGQVVEPDHEARSAELGTLRNRLNDFAFAMNTPVAEGGLSPHGAIGIMERYCRMDPPLASVELPAAAEWSNRQINQYRAHAALVARHLTAVGNPQRHPWRGVMVPALLPSDARKLASLAGQLLAELRQLRETLEAVGKPLGFEAKYTLTYCAPMVALSNLLIERPESDVGGIANPVWLTNHANISALLSDGSRFAKLHFSLLEDVPDDALGKDYSEERKFIQEKGNSAARFFSPDYWRARKRVLQTCRKGKQPRNYKQAVRLLEDLCKYRELHASITARDELGLKAFASQWESLQSDWTTLQRVLDWVPQIIQLVRTNSILKNCDRISPQDVARERDEIRELEAKIEAVLDEWNKFLKYDYVEAFSSRNGCDNVFLDDWITRLEAASSRIEAVYEWIEYRKSRDVCKELGMQPLVDLFDQGSIQPERLVPQYAYSSAEEILRTALTTRPVLGEFDGETHEHLIEQFRALDKKLIETTRQYLACRLWERMPQPTIGDPDASPMNYLISTLRRRRGIPPIRQLMERGGNIVTQIKPCFMMSPMSIAQFLPPNSLEFDVMVIDEASQMKPEDALGALARCKQCVVVGDSKQLPPTTFFDRLGESDEDEENLGDCESILEAAAHPIGGMQGGRMLRWHYRSKHESLIAFSNKEFYESKLYVFPSPVRTCKDLGLVGHYLPDGLYARSGSRKNLVEAEAVAKTVMEHARKCGDTSLGVVALSKQQQEAIMDKLEDLRRENEDTEWFFDTARHEPFFVKNLENVQGDERDVIFISVGYGKDPQGYLRMNFGPINREGGWRRLNVLITRARLRCEVFHSIKPDEIRVTDLADAERYSLRGRVALRNYLEYIQTGQLEQPDAPGGESESPFEESVAETLSQYGVEVVPQVGVAGFRIDLGVVDSKRPGRYLLGIECDGRTYHSARSARDRDRLRQEVLESLGWKIHRIWSLDWLKDRDKETRRLLLAIEETKDDNVEADGPTTQQDEPHESTTIRRTETRKEARAPHELVSEAYRRYSGNILQGHPSEAGTDRLARLVVGIVQVESPIHIDELSKRVAEAYGLQRTGSRIQESVRLAVFAAERGNLVRRKQDFLWLPTMKRAPVRNRLHMGMDVEKIAPEEIREASETIYKVAQGLSIDALVIEVARCLGYQRVSANIDSAIRSALRSR